MLPHSILALRSCSQSSFLQILIVRDEFQKRFHANTQASELCDLNPAFCQALWTISCINSLFLPRKKCKRVILNHKIPILHDIALHIAIPLQPTKIIAFPWFFSKPFKPHCSTYFFLFFLVLRNVFNIILTTRETEHLRPLFFKILYCFPSVMNSIRFLIVIITDTSDICLMFYSPHH